MLSFCWKTRLLSSWVLSLEHMAIGVSFEEIIKRVAKFRKCLSIVPRNSSLEVQFMCNDLSYSSWVLINIPRIILRLPEVVGLP